MPWRLARSLEQLRTEVHDLYGPTTVWTVGDDRHCGVPNPTSDHCPDTVPRGIVAAVDIVGRNTAYDVWERLLLSRDARIKYMIFDGKIVSSQVSPWQIRNYFGANPHTNHLHVSVRPLSRFYDDRATWLTRETTMSEKQIVTATRNVDNDLRRIRISLRAIGRALDVPVDIDGPADGTHVIA